jgi:hypothetical protein
MYVAPSLGMQFSRLRDILDYWDSFWIVKGLIESELYDIVNATLQNFMDQIEHIGFIPNGGRIYCAFLAIHSVYSA